MSVALLSSSEPLRHLWQCTLHLHQQYRQWHNYVACFTAAVCGITHGFCIKRPSVWLRATDNFKTLRTATKSEWLLLAALGGMARSNLFRSAELLWYHPQHLHPRCGRQQRHAHADPNAPSVAWHAAPASESDVQGKCASPGPQAPLGHVHHPPHDTPCQHPRCQPWHNTPGLQRCCLCCRCVRFHKFRASTWMGT